MYRLYSDNRKAKKIILGIGGSATNDCGIGVAKAVGIKFLDSKNNEVGNNVSNFINIKKINLLEDFFFIIDYSHMIVLHGEGLLISNLMFVSLCLFFSSCIV